MTDPHRYIDEILQNLRKIQSQGAVTSTENALFGMIDGLAGLLRSTLERVAKLEVAVADLRRAAHTHVMHDE